VQHTRPKGEPQTRTRGWPTQRAFRWVGSRAAGTKGTIKRSSGTNGGITAATNHIGLVTQPEERKLAIAVSVTDCRANEDTGEGARIAKAAYEEAIIRK
jgi:hypothetical protein